jgi:hypothetical protein
MNSRAMAGIGVLTLVGVATLWWWFVQCEQECAVTDRDAQTLFQRGEFYSVLVLINAVDTKCHCSRFTSGDPPTQYSLAQACIRQLREKGLSRDVEDFLIGVRSPILKELAKR